jgi:hypothetical protein
MKVVECKLWEEDLPYCQQLTCVLVCKSVIGLCD